jgi:single-strand DNA-binding protein
MRQYEQDWLELGFRVAKAMHYQARWARSYLEQAAIEAEGAAEQEQQCSVEPRGGMPMPDTTTAIVGNLTDDPEVRYTEAGIARAVFRVAVSGRREQEASFFTVVVWRDQAEHAAQSLSKGSRVVVVGRLQQRSWTAEDGHARSVVEVVAEELGASLRWATATTTRTTRSQAR